MESFRVRYATPESEQERTLLLPMSFGACSIALLHVLSAQLKVQREKTGRTGFRLRVVHVVDDWEGDGVLSNAQAAMAALQERWAEHEYDILPLSTVMKLDETRGLLPASLGQEDAGGSQQTPSDALLSLLLAAPSVTSRADLHALLLRKLLLHNATSSATPSSAVLWAHSTTRLASLTLSETAKGRGSTLPYLLPSTTATESSFGVPFYYPMQDLLAKEISAFCSFQQPSLDPLILTRDMKPAVSTKNMTIDDLVRQYFEGVEKEFPSIVANVVKTTGKLQGRSLKEVEQTCELCDLPLDRGSAPERSRLCYGCIRNFSPPTKPGD